MVIAGSAEFLLNIQRPYIYCLEFPLIEKIDKKDPYGTHLYKIGLTLSTREAQKRLDAYHTYFAPFSYQLTYILVFSKDTAKHIVEACEKFIFNTLKSDKQLVARPLANTARMNRHIKDLDKDSREWWETKQTNIRKVFEMAKVFVKKKFNTVTLLVGVNNLKYEYRLTGKNIPKDIALSVDEKKSNNTKIQEVRSQAKKYLEALPKEQRDQWHNPPKYFQIDKSYKD
jgi:hypothetical protein